MRAQDTDDERGHLRRPGHIGASVGGAPSERGISGVPVVDAEKQVVGIVREEDLLSYNLLYWAGRGAVPLGRFCSRSDRCRASIRT